MNLKKLSGLILSAGLGVGVLGSCKSVERDYESVLKRDSTTNYREFLGKYPNSQYTAIVKEKLEECEKRDYVRFQLEKILDSSLGGAKEKNVFDEATPNGYNLQILTNLLEDPIVRGKYGSEDSLRGDVKNRVASVYRIVFTNAPTLKFDAIAVEYGGVFKWGGSGTIYFPLYATSIDGRTTRQYDWSKISNEEIEGMWQVERDKINWIQPINNWIQLDEEGVELHVTEGGN